MNPRMKAVLWFFLSWAILGLGATQFYRTADVMLLFVLAILMIAMVAMKIRNLWRHRHDPKVLEAHRSSGQGSILPPSWNRWMLGEDAGKKQTH